MQIDITDEVRAAHADLGPLAVELLDYIAADPEARARPMPNSQLPQWMSYYTYPWHPWPILVDAAKQREIERATVGVTRLIKSVPERIFQNDPKRLSDHYQLGNEMVAMFLFAPPNGIPGALGRCDMLDTADGFKCMEMNMSGNIGGWQLRFAEQRYRALPMLARFFADRGVTPVFRDSWRELLGHIVQEVRSGPVAPAGEINLALVLDELWPELAEGAKAYLDPILDEVLAGLGAGLTGQVVVTTYPGSFATQRGMRLLHGGLPIHGVIEHCQQLTPQEIYRCFKAESIRLYNGPISRLLSDKRNLALLSEHAGSGAFDAEERALIDAYVPWSRAVGDKVVTWQGEEAPLRDLLLRHQERFVVKPATGMQGDGVAVGPRLGREAWEQAVATAFAEGDWLAQQAEQSRPLLGLTSDLRAIPHDVVWGTFCFGDRYAGGFLRLMEQGVGDGIVNSARGATEGLMFEV